MKTPEQIARETVNRITAFDAGRILTGRDAELIAEEAIEADRAQRDIGRYNRDLTVQMLRHLIRQMIDGFTLPQLDEEEIADLATRAEDGLIPYIVEVDEYPN